MRAFVFTDKALTSQAGRFVWLEIDTEKPQNAPFRKQFPVQALPTMFVIDPATEKVALRWVGGATLPQFEKILDDGRVAVAGGGKAAGAGKKAGAAGDPARAAADAAQASADRAYGTGDNAAAVKGYEEALAKAPADWPGYSRTVESLLFALSNTDGCDRGAQLARDAFPKLLHTPSAANVAASGLDCALELPADNPQRQALVTALEADARAVVADTTLQMAADDRSGVYGSLLGARKEAKDEAGAKQVATEWAAFLEGVATRAQNPEQRTAFDSHRLTAYIELGHAERAIPMLEASERDLPDDYNPPARLAIAYKNLQRWDEALAASDRALAKVYGPRKLGLLQTRAEIYMGRGDASSARSTLEQAIQVAESLPPGQRSESTIASLKKKLAAIPQS